MRTVERAQRASIPTFFGRRAFFAAGVVWTSVVLASGAARAQPRQGVPHGRRAVVLPGAHRDEPRPGTRRAFEKVCARPATSMGKNILLEPRYAGGRADRLAAMAEELVRLKVDVILAGGQPAREAALRATKTIPIVTLSGSDPVREGWARSLAQPGGNVTGLTFTFPEVAAKRLELLKEALPTLTRVAIVIDPIEVVDAVDVLRETEAGARRLGLQMQVLEIHGRKDLETAFAKARRGNAEAILAMAMWPHRDEAAALAARSRLALMGEGSDEAEAGFLIAYGADLDDLVRRSAIQIGQDPQGRARRRPADRATDQVPPQRQPEDRAARSVRRSRSRSWHARTR